jgi:branched-chain amino acid aminotransferase
MSNSDQRLVYVDGRLVPENEATVSVFDVGRLYGVTLYESIRTFRHQFFRLEAHLRRLEGSLAYAGLRDVVGRQQIVDAIQAVFDANIHLTHTDDDMWVCVEVTPGREFPMSWATRREIRPTIIAYSGELPYASNARAYAEGKHVVTSLFRNVPPQCFEQRCKNRSRFPHYL